jgi:acetoin utilization deacetylase AcuC-like enzyme
VAAVAAALKGVEMVVGANCVNAFCAVRPPGHHAGRDLHPMKAVSNGFCLLNAVACAALYAVTPKSSGGLGLKRVCVIDFDVHHGNGTQDILCSTYDSRFLYVSTHAGGASINGFDEDDSPNEYLGSLSRRRKIDGIFPGRCGDFSPHDGVLNLPLGKQVTAEAFGLALTSQIYPAVEKFAPDLILLSAGFDAHKNDPLGMGSLSADDFGLITNELCTLARRVCSGRLLSILEGGYGVPCCRPPLRKNLFLPDQTDAINQQVMDLGEELPDDMEDNLDTDLVKKTANCHQEGFLDCVKEHVASLRESACELGKKSFV